MGILSCSNRQRPNGQVAVTAARKSATARPSFRDVVNVGVGTARWPSKLSLARPGKHLTSVLNLRRQTSAAERLRFALHRIANRGPHGHRISLLCQSVAIMLVLALMTGCAGVSANSTSSGSNGSGSNSTAPQLTTSPTSLNFGTVTLCNSKQLAAAITNSGGTTANITQATVSGSGFSLSGVTLPMELSAGQSTTVTLTFTPQASGGANGNLSIASNATDAMLTLPLTGNAVAPGSLVASPASLSFGNVSVGSVQELSATLTNTGGTSISISQAGVTGAAFGLSGLTLPASLGAGQSLTMSVSFAPTTTGAVTGNVSITSSASTTPLTVTLSGSGVTAGALTASPGSVNFGTVSVGSSLNQPVTLTNTGGSALSISQAAVTGTGFSISGFSLPATLSAGQTLSLTATFAPTASGVATGNIAITNSASSTPLNVSLAGTGAAAGAVTASPAAVNFNNVVIGNSLNQTVTLNNTGGSAVSITQAALTGGAFQISGLSLPTSLGAGQSLNFTATFAPSSPGAASGNIAVTTSSSSTALNIPLSGIGVSPGSLIATPASVNFGNVLQGNNQSQSVTLTNSGGSSLTIAQATITGSGFSITGLSVPITLTAGQSIGFTATFAPQSLGAVSGNIAVVNGSSTLNIPLSGTGIAQGSLTAAPASLDFGTVQTGSNQTLSVNITNSGGSNVTVSQATISGTGFSLGTLALPFTLAAGQSKSATVTFAPTSAGAASGNLAIISNASNPTLNIALSGTGVTPGSLTASPSSLNFGNVQVGSNSSLTEKITNSGGSSVVLNQASISDTGFTFTGLTVPLTLTAGQSVSFTVTFTPTASGSASGSLSITSNAPNPNLSIPLSGNGTIPATLAVSPSSLNFGNVTVGSSANLTGTLTASGSSVTVTSATSNNAKFTLSGISFPVTISAGQSTQFTVTFTPQSSGAASGTITFVSNATNSPTVQSESGTGIAPPPHSVDLTWNASTSVVVGYNVYRGTKSGGPYSKMNSSLDGSTAYTDSTVQAGQTYFFVTTAVDATGAESVYSNEVTAVIPTP